jgi:hypothetical protein
VLRTGSRFIFAVALWLRVAVVLRVLLDKMLSLPEVISRADFRNVATVGESYNSSLLPHRVEVAPHSRLGPCVLLSSFGCRTSILPYVNSVE